jgi:putative metalloprotease
MLKFLPILLIIVYSVLLWRFSVWRTRAELEARSTPLADPQLAPVLSSLASALGVRQVPVLLYDAEPVNGLASPDGRIYLTRGFFQKFRDGEVSADELASVVAHELGHVALGHARRRAIDFTGQNAVRAPLAGLLGRLIPGIGVWLAGMATALVAARLSRREEYEADAYASALLVKAGIGTEPQKSLFRKLGRLTGQKGQPAAAWLMSHPATSDRIAAIEANERKWGVGA